MSTAAYGLVGRVGIFVPIRPLWGEKVGGALHSLGRFFRQVKTPVTLWCSRFVHLLFGRGGATAASQHGMGLLLWAFASFGLAALTGGLVTLAILQACSGGQGVLHTHTVRHIYGHRISTDIRVLAEPRLQASVSSSAPPVLRGLTPSSRLPSVHNAPSLSCRAPAPNPTYSQIVTGHPSNAPSATKPSASIRGARTHQLGQGSGMVKSSGRLLASVGRADKASSSFSHRLAAELRTGGYEVTAAEWETAELRVEAPVEDAPMVVVPDADSTDLLPILLCTLALLVTSLVVWRVSRKSKLDTRNRQTDQCQQAVKAPAPLPSPQRSPRLIDKRASLPFAAGEVPDLSATFANSGRTIRAAAPLQFQITSSSKDALGATAKTRTITAAGGLIKHWDTRRLGPAADEEHGEAGGDQASRAEQQEDEGDEEDEERDLAFVNQPQAEVHADQGMDRVEIPMPSLGRMATGAGMLHDDIMSPVMEQEEGPQKDEAEPDLLMTCNMEINGTTKMRRHSWGGSIKPTPTKTIVQLTGTHVVDKVEFFESLRMVHEAQGAHALKPTIDHRGNRLTGTATLHEPPAEEKVKKPTT